MNCRHCKTLLTLQFVDLGSSPPSNAYLTATALRESERWFPLRVLVCRKCWLVQTEDYSAAGEIFTEDYAYFSSYSRTWRRHAEHYVQNVVERFALGPHSRVVELAANDGYLLQFVAARNIPCVGVEPTASTAQAARAKNDFVRFLVEAWHEGKSVAAYRAAAKGNTFLNYAGVRADLLSFVVGMNPA